MVEWLFEFSFLKICIYCLNLLFVMNVKEVLSTSRDCAISWVNFVVVNFIVLLFLLIVDVKIVEILELFFDWLLLLFLFFVLLLNVFLLLCVWLWMFTACWWNFSLFWVRLTLSVKCLFMLLLVLSKELLWSFVVVILSEFNCDIMLCVNVLVCGKIGALDARLDATNLFGGGVGDFTGVFCCWILCVFVLIFGVGLLLIFFLVVIVSFSVCCCVCCCRAYAKYETNDRSVVSVSIVD